VPIFFQHPISKDTRLGIWKIEESEDFFKRNVPQHRDVTHPHKRLQHLAGRFLLQFLFPDFPYELIQIAETRKPFLAGDPYHFSISHCGDYAAAIVSRRERVGVDIEIPTPKIEKIRDKFLDVDEQLLFRQAGTREAENIDAGADRRLLTLLWSAKEAVFKWHGEGGVDFKKHIRLQKINNDTIDSYFTKTNQQLIIQYRQFEQVVLAWI
jgi:4'-phosphopantetheinyl transferase